MRPVDSQLPDLYERTSGPLRAHLLRSTEGDAELAEDILQDTWVRAIASRRRTGIPARPAAWLSVVARNLLSNVRRQRRRTVGIGETLLENLVDPSAAADVHARLELAERDAVLRTAMSQLPRADSDLLDRFYADRMSVAAIASSLNLSDRAVEGRLRRARAKLRAILATEHTQSAAVPAFAAESAASGAGVPPLVKKAVMLAWLPLALLLAFAPLAFMVNRLPPRRRAQLRLVCGALLLMLTIAYATISGRVAYLHLLQLIAFGLMTWAIIMLRASWRAR
jgi:RNA polymerase sigma-70 factor (ECF subfamily)